MTKRITALCIALLVIAGLGLFAIAWHPAIRTVTPPTPDSFDRAQIDRGEVLAGLGDCAICHTADPTKPFAGGVALPTKFGTVYSANITPDADDGIGGWSKAAFVRAMRAGIMRNGSYLFPAFPYDHFTKIKDEDLDALYAYIMTRKPVNNTPPENALRFPFNIRLLQGAWQLLFFEPGSFEPDANHDAQWNRGAYLAEGLGHCGACHTPRNTFGAEDSSRSYAGALIDNWYAPALDAAGATPVGWVPDQIFDYLRVGGTPYQGVATGSMSDIVHGSLRRVSDQDLRALAVYFGSINESATTENAAATASTEIHAAHTRAAESRNRGERIFAAACEACHYNTATTPMTLRPELSLNSAVTAPDPINLIRVTLEGVSIDDGMPGAMMRGSTRRSATKTLRAW